MTGVAGRDSLSPDMKRLLSEIPVGAIMLFKYNIADTPQGVHRFIAECTHTSSLVLPENLELPGLKTQNPFSGSNNLASMPSITNMPATIKPESPTTEAPGVGATIFESHNSPSAVSPDAGTILSTTTAAAIADAAEPQHRLMPFVAIDHEGGDVYRLGQVATRLPPASRYLSASSNESGTASPASTISTTGTPGSSLSIPLDTWFTIRQAAYLSGRELRALGITMNLAPVAEPLTPENRDFLQNRSFAADPSAVASAAAAFIQGMGEAGVVSVVKHFPASAAADPHHSRSVLTVEKKRLLTLASPFEALLKNYGTSTNLDSLYPESLLKLPIHAGGVMVAHTIVPALEPDVPASLSSRVMQDWIKESIGFSGIVLADDFTMKAITSTGISPEAAIIRSLMAGSDMVMVWPRDLGRFHRLLVERAKSDTLFRTRLVDAASRIITIKLLQGLTLGPEAVPESFNDEGYGCMRKATEQVLRERNLR